MSAVLQLPVNRPADDLGQLAHEINDAHRRSMRALGEWLVAARGRTGQAGLNTPISLDMASKASVTSWRCSPLIRSAMAEMVTAATGAPSGPSIAAETEREPGRRPPSSMAW